MLEASFKIEGADELIRRLERIGNDSKQRGINRKAVRAGATPFRKAARAELKSHKKTGRLRKGIVTKVKTYLGNVVVAITGADATTAPHAHLLEFGTVERFHKGGKSVGSGPAIGFFRRAFDASASKSQSQMIAKLKQELDKL